MRRCVLLVMLSLCLSACEALAISAAPAPVTAIAQATVAPRPTWPPTWTPTATPTPRPTATVVPPTLTPTPIEIDHQNRAAALKYPATPTPVKVRRTPSAVATGVPISPAVELRVFAIGDSVMLGAARELQKTIPGIEVDAKVSRHVSATLAILQQRRAAGKLGKVVIVHIGDNGYLTAKQFDDLMQPLIDLPRVVVVNLKVPRKWEAPNNLVIAEGVARYSNAVLIDWHTYGMDHPELFAKDGIHIGAAGAKAYAALVLAQINGFVGGPADRPVDKP
ncbi:MAG: hypothetical protein HY870_13250 [Chloroflexi bacterium]|nr:hypothetical protein [Chloroflexota bacterium]